MATGNFARGGGPPSSHLFADRTTLDALPIEQLAGNILLPLCRFSFLKKI